MQSEPSERKSRNRSADSAEEVTRVTEPTEQIPVPAPVPSYTPTSVTVERLWRHARNGYFLIAFNGDQRMIEAKHLPESNELSIAAFNDLEIPRWVTAQLPPEEE